MENDFSADLKPKLPQKLFHKKIDSAHQILIHPSKPFWIVVNNFGWEVMQKFDGENSLADILNILKSNYNADDTVIKRELCNFMSDINRSGILSHETAIKKVNPIEFKSAFMHLTYNCNLHCKHCYVTELDKKEEKPTDQEGIIRFLEQFYLHGGEELTLGGGEPLLVKNITRYLEINPKAKIKILTNATLIDDNFASLFERFNISIQVSIDGSNDAVHDSIRGRGAFNKMIKGINNLKKRGFEDRITFCTTIMQQNIVDLPNILELASRMAVNKVRFIPLKKMGNAKSNWDELQSGLTAGDYENFYTYIYDEAIKKYPDITISCGLDGFVLQPQKLSEDNHWCSIGKTLGVDTFGNVYPCFGIIDERFKLGNIKNNSLKDLKENSMLLNLMDVRIERKNKISKCNECMWKNFCQGGCMALALDGHDSIWDTDEFCDIRIKLYEKAVLELTNHTNLRFSQQGNNLECS